MILICSIFLTFIRLSNTAIEPTVAMCIDGEIDTAVLTRDGSTFLFMKNWFWKLNQKLDAVIGNGSKISDHWFSLPENVQTSFYVSGQTNRLNGKTFFVKNGIWYQFDNQTFEMSGSTEYWPGFPSGYSLAISQYDDPVVVFYQRHSINKKRVAYYFDSPYFPQSKEILKENLPFDYSKTQAVISYPNRKFLFFIDDDRIGEHCLMEDSSSGCVQVRPNRHLFNCPDYTDHLFDTNTVIRFWYWSGLRLKHFTILILGFLSSLSLIFLFLLLILGLRLISLIKSKFNS